jgi:hypothetical protein
MGGVNSWLTERLNADAEAEAAVDASLRPQSIARFIPEIIDVIVEVEDPTALKNVSTDIAALLPGKNFLPTAFGRFINVSLPVGFIDRVSSLAGVRLVSYNAPVWIRGAPTKNDPLLGTIGLSPIVVPEGVSKALFTAAIHSPLSILGLGANALGNFAAVGGPKNPNVIFTPTSETRILTGVPEDDNKINTKVAVLDTGIGFPHPLFRPQNGVPELLSTTGELPLDGLGHGMWCCSTAFGGTFNSRFGKLQGVADAGSNLISVKCLSNAGFGTNFNVIKAMELAVDRGAKVISMSLGGPLQGSVNEDPQCRMVELLKDDVIFVVAAGNDGPNAWTIGSPGASPFAITVGAWSTYYGGPAIFSSRGPNGDFYELNPGIFQRDLQLYGSNLNKPDVVAPGGGPVVAGDPMDLIYSGVTGWMDGIFDYTPGDGFDGMRGTSMATPHAAGVIAYAFDRGLIRTAADVIKLMAKGVTKNTTVGYGLINLERLTPQTAPGGNAPDGEPVPEIEVRWQGA